MVSWKPSLFVLSLLSLGILTSGKPSGKENPFILGGKEAAVGAWPWMASIRVGGSHLCGGALIKPTVVLTSATCINGQRPSEVRVVLGLHDQENFGVGAPEEILISTFIVHEDWNLAETTADIALIKLRLPASDNKFIKPIALPKKDDDFSNQECIFTGWGSVDLVVLISRVLHQTTLRIWTNEECSTIRGETNERVRCTTNDLDFGGSCVYDIGGPLVCPVKGGYVLAGCNARPTWARGCGRAIPSLFTNIPTYLAWIEKYSS